MYSFIKKNAINIVTGIIFSVLLFLPIYIQSGLYYAGGDDTRLYYIYPEKFLQNLSLTVISDNSLGGANTGYYPTSQMAPLLYVILFLKTLLPFVNTQNLMYGLNYAFGFLFFSLLIGIWIKSKTTSDYSIKIVSSLFFVFSPFLMGTLYKHHLLAIYLVSIMPMLLYFFIRAVYENKFVFTIASVTLFSIFSATINTFPHWIPIGITSIPLLVWLFITNKASFLKQTFIFVVVGVLINFHWIYHLVNSQYFIKGLASSFDFYSSTDFVEANINGIRGTATLFSPLSVVFTTMDRLFMNNFSLIVFISGVFLLVIVSGGIFLPHIKDSLRKELYVVLLISFLFSWFLFSPNLGKWGPDFFVWLSTSLPFMTMFRNMYDKFALPLGFYFALTFAISLLNINSLFKRSEYVRVLFSVFILFIVLLNARALFQQKVLSEGTIATVTGNFNDDFNNLVDYLNNLNNASRILWMPMTAPNYVSVEDKHLEGHYYSGLSPLRIFTGRGDYAGRFSFLIPGQNFGDRYLKLIVDKKYEEFGEAMQRMNARYIILDKQLLPEAMQSFLYDEDRKYLKLQSDDYKNNLLGNKIVDFGDRYSLYEINDKYFSDRIFLTSNINEFSESGNDLYYKKLASNEYEVQLSNLKDKKVLVFMDPYYKQWSLSVITDRKNIPLNITNQAAFGWVNSWELDPAKLKEVLEEEGQEDNLITLKLFFEPARVNNILYKFSIASYALAFSLIGWHLIKSVKKIYV
jgi:hypothetical protein